jgi:hypothetical protein
VADDPDAAALVAAVVRLVRPEHLTEDVLRHGALYGGWARRARFFGR